MGAARTRTVETFTNPAETPESPNKFQHSYALSHQRAAALVRRAALLYVLVRSAELKGGSACLAKRTHLLYVLARKQMLGETRPLGAGNNEHIFRECYTDRSNSKWRKNEEEHHSSEGDGRESRTADLEVLVREHHLVEETVGPRYLSRFNRQAVQFRKMNFKIKVQRKSYKISGDEIRSLG